VKPVVRDEQQALIYKFLATTPGTGAYGESSESLCNSAEGNVPANLTVALSQECAKWIDTEAIAA
jgi:hypothetical protein